MKELINLQKVYQNIRKVGTMPEFKITKEMWEMLEDDMKEIKKGVFRINGRVRKNELKIATIGGGLMIVSLFITLWASGVIHVG